MNNTIRKYYESFNFISKLIDKKIHRFEQYPDICEEFVYWIENKTYKDGGIEVNGYSAKDIASISEFADGETAFLTLIELRENPDRAMRRIKEGFKKK